MEEKAVVKRRLMEVACFVLGWNILYMLLAQVAFALFGSTSLIDKPEFSYYFLIFFWCVYFAILWVCRCTKTLKTVDWKVKMSVPNVLMWFGAAYVLQTIGYVIVLGLDFIMRQGKMHILQPEVSVESATGIGYVVSMLTICVIAPVFEELLFRNLILERMRVLGDKTAIIVTGVLFGIFHGNIPQAVQIALVGILLCYVAVHFSLWWAIVLHILNNTFVQVATEFDGKWVSYVLTYLWLFLGLYALVVLIQKRKAIVAFIKEKGNWRAAFLSSPLFIIMWIYLLWILFHSITIL
jgi:membrane protease YdiL (CAAX protease family)